MNELEMGKARENSYNVSTSIYILSKDEQVSKLKTVNIST